MPKHIHADLMALYAQDAQASDKPWLRWEATRPGDNHPWVALTAHPTWDSTLRYRQVVPKTVVNGITLDDTRLTAEAISVGQVYFMESLGTPHFYLDGAFSGFGLEVECLEQCLERGILHRTAEGAIAFCKARLGIAQ